MTVVLLSLGVLCALLLLMFGTRLVVTRPDDRLRGGLMIAVAIITLWNVYNWAGIASAGKEHLAEPDAPSKPAGSRQ